MTKTLTRIQKVFFALGTVNSITVFDLSDADAVIEAKERVLELHGMLNAFDENSEVSLINRNAGKKPVKVSGEVFRLIEDSVKLSVITDGLFDITSRPLSQIWKKAIRDKAMPKGFDLIRATLLCDYKDIQLNSEEMTVKLRNKGQQIDLGGIAKGYVADEVRRILEEYGVTDAVINLGGSVINMGETRRIGLQNPFEKTGTPFAFITADDKAVVSSGIYEQCFEHKGRTYHHIINPRTGFPSDTDTVGASLIGDNCELLDALATAAVLMKPAEAMKLFKSFNVEAVLVTEEGKVIFTEGMRNNLAFKGN